MLLAEADRRMGLTQAAADAIGDDRRLKSVVHATRDIIRRRTYGLILGHEDLNDHGRLRLDPALQEAVMRDGAMASTVDAVPVRAQVHAVGDAGAVRGCCSSSS